MSASYNNTKASFDFWHNQKFRSLAFQMIILLIVFAIIAFGLYNLFYNYSQQNRTFGFDFLQEKAGYPINDSWIAYSSSTSTNLDAMWVGVVNTLRVAVFGIIVATILGFILGVLRLSKNWLVSKVVSTYIEVTRNIPVLLQIIFWHSLLTQALPRPKHALSLDSIFFLHKKGLNVPKPIFEHGFSWVLGAFTVALIATFIIRYWSKNRQHKTGLSFPTVWVSLALLIGLPLIVFLLTKEPLTWQIPKLGRFNFKGGLTLRPEFIALWGGLSIYTASFIAEIVRAGIMSVDKGQTEAAYALGLKPGITMQKIIIPQAMRVIIPPLASQYMNLMKNSSLALAVGYVDIMGTIGGTTLNQTGKEVECMMIVLALYLTASLTISFLMNLYNNRVRLIER